jgi:Transposase zinc-ribbon domain
MTGDEARDTFKRIRWLANDGEPFCPHCGCLTVYTLAEVPPRWKCGRCRRKFSLTSQTLFHSRKLPVRDYLAVIALFVNGVKGTSALQITRDLNINPKGGRRSPGPKIIRESIPSLDCLLDKPGFVFLPGISRLRIVEERAILPIRGGEEIRAVK